MLCATANAIRRRRAAAELPGRVWRERRPRVLAGTAASVRTAASIDLTMLFA
jgi:hypothetical protein